MVLTIQIFLLLIAGELSEEEARERLKIGTEIGKYH